MAGENFHLFFCDACMRGPKNLATPGKKIPLLHQPAQRNKKPLEMVVEDLALLKEQVRGAGSWIDEKTCLGLGGKIRSMIFEEWKGWFLIHLGTWFNLGSNPPPRMQSRV